MVMIFASHGQYGLTLQFDHFTVFEKKCTLIRRQQGDQSVG